jgi:hypothetical protein
MHMQKRDCDDEMSVKERLRWNLGAVVMLG